MTTTDSKEHRERDPSRPTPVQSGLVCSQRKGFRGFAQSEDRGQLPPVQVGNGATAHAAGNLLLLRLPLRAGVPPILRPAAEQCARLCLPRQSTAPRRPPRLCGVGSTGQGRSSVETPGQEGSAGPANHAFTPPSYGLVSPRFRDPRGK